MTLSNVRIETDSLGEVAISLEAAWESQTQHAIDNFPITGVRINHYPELIVALAQIKAACARANFDLGTITKEQANTIISVSEEVIVGKHHDQFVVDVMQGDAGTSTNMNINEANAK